MNKHRFMLGLLGLLLAAAPALAQTLGPGINRGPTARSFDSTGAVPRLGGPLEVRPIPFNPGRLFGLPGTWAQDQYRQYGRAVVALNRVLARGNAPADQSLALQLFNRQALLYSFLDSLGGEGPPTRSVVLNLMQQQGLSYANWQAQVLALAPYLADGGWIVWEYNLISGSSSLYPAHDETDLKLGSLPLVTLNLSKEAYRGLAEGDPAAYTRLLLANIDWEGVADRLIALGFRN